MAVKLKPPASSRVDFGKPIQQDGWNVDKNVDSTAIKSIAYNPEEKELKIKFRPFDWLEYTYYGVPVRQVQKLIDGTLPRRRSLPKRADSIGSTFYSEIRAKRYQYKRTVSENPPSEGRVRRGKERR